MEKIILGVDSGVPNIVTSNNHRGDMTVHIGFGSSHRRNSPRRIRVRVYRDSFGITRYQPQAKYWFFWQDNCDSTKKPYSFLWAINSLGFRLEDLEFVGIPLNNFLRGVFRYAQRKIDDSVMGKSLSKQEL